MSFNFAPPNLTHHFLIAMPNLEDETFSKSVIYLCEHTDSGALGIMINKPSDLKMRHLFEKIELFCNDDKADKAPVFLGGPVHTDRGFVLHEPVIGDAKEPLYASSMQIAGGLEMTTSRDVLEAIAGGGGPSRVLVSLGYSAWGEGQLEAELAENSWLTVAADPRVIFDTPVAQRYQHALALLGVDAWALSPQAGRA